MIFSHALLISGDGVPLKSFDALSAILESTPNTSLFPAFAHIDARAYCSAFYKRHPRSRIQFLLHHQWFALAWHHVEVLLQSEARIRAEESLWSLVPMPDECALGTVLRATDTSTTGAALDTSAASAPAFVQWPRTFQQNYAFADPTLDPKTMHPKTYASITSAELSFLVKSTRFMWGRKFTADCVCTNESGSKSETLEYALEQLHVFDIQPKPPTQQATLAKPKLAFMFLLTDTFTQERVWARYLEPIADSVIVVTHRAHPFAFSTPFFQTRSVEAPRIHTEWGKISIVFAELGLLKTAIAAAASASAASAASAAASTAAALVSMPMPKPKPVPEANAAEKAEKAEKAKAELTPHPHQNSIGHVDPIDDDQDDDQDEDKDQNTNANTNTNATELEGHLFTCTTELSSDFDPLRHATPGASERPDDVAHWRKLVRAFESLVDVHAPRALRGIGRWVIVNFDPSSCASSDSTTAAGLSRARSHAHDAERETERENKQAAPTKHTNRIGTFLRTSIVSFLYPHGAAPIAAQSAQSVQSVATQTPAPKKTRAATQTPPTDCAWLSVLRSLFPSIAGALCVMGASQFMHMTPTLRHHDVWISWDDAFECTAPFLDDAITPRHQSRIQIETTRLPILLSFFATASAAADATSTTPIGTGIPRVVRVRTRERACAADQGPHPLCISIPAVRRGVDAQPCACFFAHTQQQVARTNTRTSTSTNTRSISNRAAAAVHEWALMTRWLEPPRSALVREAEPLSHYTAMLPAPAREQS